MNREVVALGLAIARRAGKREWIDSYSGRYLVWEDERFRVVFFVSEETCSVLRRGRRIGPCKSCGFNRPEEFFELLGHIRGTRFDVDGFVVATQADYDYLAGVFERVKSLPEQA